MHSKCYSFIHQSITHLYMHLFIIYPSIYVFIHPSILLFVNLSSHASIYWLVVKLNGLWRTLNGRQWKSTIVTQQGPKPSYFILTVLITAPPCNQATCLLIKVHTNIRKKSSSVTLWFVGMLHWQCCCAAPSPPSLNTAARLNVAFNWAQLAEQVKSLAMDLLTLASNGAFKMLLMAGRDAATPPALDQCCCCFRATAQRSPKNMFNRVCSSMRFNRTVHSCAAW